MSITTKISEAAVRLWPGVAETIRDAKVSILERDNEALDNEVFHLQESMTRLQIELENEGYRRLTVATEHEFDRAHLETLIKLTGAMAIKNPLISRVVNVQADYVFGRGVKFKAAHPMVQAVLDEHVEYGPNQQVLYAHDAMCRQERELQVNGNLFMMLATNPRTGRITVRDIPTLEIADVIRDPQDYHNEWFFKRTHMDGNNHMAVSYHPALGVTKDSDASLPDWTDKGPILWDNPVYHAAFNKYGRMKFAIPELYCAIDWALAYKRFLEDWTSIMRSFARMAMKITGLAGKKQAAAAKSKLQTSVNLTNPLETNPSAAAASTGLFGKGIDVEPVKTAGATTDAKEGQPILNMVASGTGMPNTFFGDASQARGDQLDRPTELKMLARQRLWSGMFKIILDYVVYQSAKCTGGTLREAGAEMQQTICPFDDKKMWSVVMPTNDDEYFGEVGQPISTQIDVTFPELLERNVTDRVRALVNAVTQFGKPLSDLIPDKRDVCRLVMEALNIEGIDEKMPRYVEMWTKNMTVGDDGKPIDPIIIPPLPPTVAKGAEDPAQGGDVGQNG